MKKTNVKVVKTIKLRGEPPRAIKCLKLRDNNPRKRKDTLGKLIFFTDGQICAEGDKHDYKNVLMFIKENPFSKNLVYKVYYNETRNISLEMVSISDNNPFGEEVTSGFCGFCYIKKTEARKQLGILTKNKLHLIEKAMKAELKEYEQYLNSFVKDGYKIAM